MFIRLIDMFVFLVIILVPLQSNSHFVEPLSDCLLADICNHTWIPECAEDVEIDDRRLFIDACDVYEYSCDYDLKYKIVNYSECFGPSTCPYVPPEYITTTPKRTRKYHLRQGNYLYDEHFRSYVYAPTTVTFKGKRRYTPQRGKKAWKFLTTRCRTCPFGQPKPRDNNHIRYEPMHQQRAPPRTELRMHRIERLPPIKQVIYTATIGTVVLKTATFYLDGRKLVKKFMGPPRSPTMRTRDSLDYLEK